MSRSSGVLLSVTSLPSKYGIGCFSKEAYDFVDFLAEAGQRYWQILPLSPTNYGDSPYQSFSSYAGNPYFIDIETLIEEKLLTKEEADSFDFGSDPVKIDYAKLYKNRVPLLKMAWQRFSPDKEYYDFLNNNAFWLNDFGKRYNVFSRHTFHKFCNRFKVTIATSIERNVSYNVTFQFELYLLCASTSCSIFILFTI